MEVPVIDMSNFPAELPRLAAAAAGAGTFRVANHGMPPALTAEMKAVTRSLFDLPAEVKLRNVNEKFFAGGHMPPNTVSRPYQGLSIYDAVSVADVDSFCSALAASTHQRDVIGRFISKLHVVIVDVAYRVAESMGLRAGVPSFEGWPCLLRLNCYNIAVEDIGCVGAPTHTDSGALTLLVEDERIGGLEIMDSGGHFVAVDHVPGTFLVNVGDVGKVWSNGRLHNPAHRVVCNEAMQRITISFFILAPEDDKVEPEAAFIDAEHPKLYRAFMYNNYRMLRDKYGVRLHNFLC